jgi:hypothetical protein
MTVRADQDHRNGHPLYTEVGQGTALIAKKS